MPETFLSKLGKILATVGKIAAVAAGMEPLIQPFLGSAKAQSVAGTTVSDITQIGQVITSAEALLQNKGSGADKLAASTPLVMQVLQTSQLFTGKKIANQDLFQQGASKITSGMADLLNAVDPAEVKTA